MSNIGPWLLRTAVLLTACGGISATDGDTANAIDLSTGGNGTSEADEGPPSEAGDTSGGPTQGCESTLDCAGEICVAGDCCPTANVCADHCCAEGDLCLFGVCTAPGASCHTTADCTTGEYCELAFGAPGGGLGRPPYEGLACTQTLPPTGVCLELPQKCGEPGVDPGTCVEACEFHPVPGQLNASVKWQWGLVDAHEYPDHSDVWSTPAVARLYDANCDARVDENDPPNLVFVAGNTQGGACQSVGQPVSSCRTGVLRVLDGSSGEEVWSMDKAHPQSVGFAGVSVALGDIDRDGHVDIVALSGEGYLVMLDRFGIVRRISDQPIAYNPANFGWGGALTLGDMDGDGVVEIALGATVFGTEAGQIVHRWTGVGGQGGTLSFMVDLDGDGAQELLAGNTAYGSDSQVVWRRGDLLDGFNAIGDLDQDGTPEVVLVNGSVQVLDGLTGQTELAPVAVSGTDAFGGPPTVADFDGDGNPEIGVAGGDAYVVYNPNYRSGSLEPLWTHATKDTSSSRTGSSVFDFEGDGRAEVVYSDECFLRILDGETGALRYAAPNTTFTATEALIVADVDGDGHAEVVRVSNSANWNCDAEPWASPDRVTGRPGWSPPPGQNFYKGVTVFGDATNQWVGTRTLWNQHAYSVSNICDGKDTLCDPGDSYGTIPRRVRDNWGIPWLNNFRQNVQEDGVLDAPDATVSVDVLCASPVIAKVAVRNAGFAPLPAGVVVDVLRVGDPLALGTVVTSQMLLPGQTQVFTLELAEGDWVTPADVVAQIVDAGPATAIECRAENNQSNTATVSCAPAG